MENSLLFIFGKCMYFQNVCTTSNKCLCDLLPISVFTEYLLCTCTVKPAIVDSLK